MNCSSTEQAGFGHYAMAASRKRIRGVWFPLLWGGVLAAALPLGAAAAAGSSPSADQKMVAALDKQYQKAVEQNDAATMARILADDFVLVVGNGKAYTKTDLVEDAKSGKTHYAQQEDSDQSVRVWGDTAVVTAKLWAQGIEDGKSVDYTLWFSDTYVRTPKGWSYVFGMASLPLPKAPHK
jgi:ketosteroid isomerase-like protein